MFAQVRDCSAHVLGASGAVQPNHAHAHTLEDREHCGDICAQQHLAVDIQCDLRLDRNISANLIALTLSDKILPEMISAYFNSPVGRNVLQSIARGATIRGLNSRDILDIIIPLPSLSEQESLSHYLTLALEYDDILQKELELRQKLTDAVVLKIMKGELHGKMD